MGIGALIIFIGVILAAAVAAGVLIMTSGSLQQRALITGSESTEKVVTGLEVVDVRAWNYEGMAPDIGFVPKNNQVELLYLVVRLSPGSGPISWNNTVIIVSTKRESCEIPYYLSGNVIEDDFYVNVLKEGPNHRSHYLSEGDLAELDFGFCGDRVNENEPITVIIIPAGGRSTVLKLMTPDSITHQMIPL
jgi:archaellin